MSGCPTFFNYYGGKWRAAPEYPAPRYDTIIEPFAGAAGYSLRYPSRRVTIIERDPLVAATWRYLLSTSPAEILALPDLPEGGTVDDLSISEEAKLLVGWWLNSGTTHPCKTPSSWAVNADSYDTGGGMLSWGARVRERIASHLHRIRHWKIVEGDYHKAPDVEATWFVDPPYEIAGKHYRFGSSTIDYAELATWCRSRRGQVLVCEQVGSTWLPFQPWRTIKSSPSQRGRGFSEEALWSNEDLQDQQVLVWEST